MRTNTSTLRVYTTASAGVVHGWYPNSAKSVQWSLVVLFLIPVAILQVWLFLQFSIMSIFSLEVVQSTGMSTVL